ncbi:MAG: hypothetical protein WAL52_22720 [Candidatus Sulfotelmatobacter sp.]
MQIVQIVLDEKLLHAADPGREAQLGGTVLLWCATPCGNIRRLELRANEERDRQGYARHSQADAEARGWEAEARWPEE